MRRYARVNVKGFRKTSLLDYPGEIASVVFTGGCNLRCRFCHNSDLAYNEGVNIPVEEIITTLKKRKKIIDAVVISGGEPLIQQDIFEFISILKTEEFKIKLDTNGCSPEPLINILDASLVDYVAIDIKTSPSKYPLLTGVSDGFDAVFRSITAIRDKAPEYELRTTCVPGFVDIEELTEIRETVGHVSNYYLQQFRNESTLDSSFSSCRPYSREKLGLLKDFVSTFSDHSGIRGL
jgi:pyruvate formate lyase activating enzyme